MSALVLGCRVGLLCDDTIELLCLRKGDRCRYRLYLSTVDLGLTERQDDLEGVEFDSADEDLVRTFLVESMWYLQIEPSVLIGLGAIDESVMGTRMFGDDRAATGVVDALLEIAEKQVREFGDSSLSRLAFNGVNSINAILDRAAMLTVEQRGRLAEVRSRCSALGTTLDKSDRSVFARQHQKP
jgi:hypothetical protein